MNQLRILSLNSNDDDQQLEEYASMFDFVSYLTMSGFFMLIQALFGFTGATQFLLANTGSAIGLITIKATGGVSSFSHTLTGMDAKQIQSSLEKGLLFMSGSLVIIIYLTDIK